MFEAPIAGNVHEFDSVLKSISSIYRHNNLHEIVKKVEEPVELTRDPDFSRSFAEIVSENGFISEVHPVTTTDGYKLKVFRIKSKDTKPGAPVIFM